MKPLSKLMLAVWISTLVLSACVSMNAQGGPTVWIDQPLDGDQLSLSTLTILAHASDADGISAFEFYLSDTLLSSLPVNGERLGEASLQWQPPAPGVYRLRVRAIDRQGNPGEMVQVQIMVGEAPLSPATPSAITQCAVEALTAPTLISPADGVNIETSPLLSWSYPDPTCHPHSFAIDISPDPSFSDNRLGFATLDYNETSRSWPLPAGQCYYWRARAYVPDSFGPPSLTWSFCLLALATSSVTVPATPSATAPTPSPESPTFSLLQNANCRAGPSTMYNVEDTLMKDTSVVITGRNAENSWLWVARPSGNGYCWVSLSVGNASGNWTNLPIIAAPPLPSTPTWTLPPFTPTPTLGYIISTVIAPDFTPPQITNVSINPPNINKQGCGTPNTLTLRATVTDASGVGNVIYELRGPGPMDAGDGYLLPLGGDVYQAVIGPIAGSAGIWSITLRSVDIANNTAQAGPWTFQVLCIQ